MLLKKVSNHEDLLDNDPFKDEVAQEPTKPTPPPRTGKLESVPRKRVDEDLILPPPDGYKPIPKPKTDRPLKIQNARRPPKPTRKPPPVPQAEEHTTNVPVPKIKELNRALKGHAKSYEIELQDNLYPLNHFTKTRPQTESRLEDLLKTMKGFKFIEALEVTFEKDTIDSKTGKRVSIYKTAFFNGKAKIVTKVDDLEPELNMSRQEILNMIDKWVSEGSGWVIDRIDSHHINVTLYKPLNGSSYIELPTELRNPKKGLIKIKNKDAECFRWCHIGHLNPQEKDPQRIKKEEKKMINELNYEGIESPVSQKHYNKVEKRNSIGINVFGYENGRPFPIHISKETFEDQMNLLLIIKDTKKHYVLIRDFNAFMYNQSKHKERKHFCMYCLQCFSSERILANHVNNCLTIIGAQAINMPKQGENILKFNNFYKQLPVPFVIYADFEAKKGEKQDLNINAIPNNMEKYMAFMLGNHLTFIDSFQFMSSSLDKLVSNLPKDDLIYTSKAFKGKRLDLMSQKGVYPYDYMDSFEKFNEKELPTKDQFHSILNDQHITDDEYNHAKEVWNTFMIGTLGDYHDLYLVSHVLLLTDVFENFRKTCMQYYKLDPCHYFTSPGLSCDAMSKITNIKLELMTDIDMFQFIEKGMRGGVSYIANRYGNANNKYMKEYNEKAPSKHITYLDANNLYGWAMSQYLPTGNLKWMTDKELSKTNLGKYELDSKEGLILEVDLEYPKELHDQHNDYPIAPEKVKVSNNMLSAYCKKIAEKYNISIGLVRKINPTLRDKKEYVLHYRNLELYLDLDLKIKKIHRVLKFDQSLWLKQYIDFNTEKRMHAKNSFEMDFFKLMNNRVFGKTMENLRKRVDVRLVTNEKKLNKLTSKPTFVISKIFNENLMAVHKIKETLTLNRPAYVGMCILDFSKTLMYDFHYNYIKKKYNDRAKLLFTDTDSLIYEIETVDAYKDFWTDKDMFDNSDYPENSPYHCNTNKKIIGKFKDEACGIPITEFVGLKSKMSSYVKDNEKGGKAAKGIKKNVINNNIRHEDYKRTLLNEEQMHHKMKTIRSQRHQLGSYEIITSAYASFFCTAV